jgi:5-methylcytosine-specific restriction endonuclease McrA
MAKDFSKKFYNSRAWKATRNGYRSSVHYQCERCYNPGLEVHHKIALTPSNINDANVSLNWSNLELLCFRCHQRETKGTEGVTQDGLMFDDEGQVVPIGYAPLKNPQTQ